MKLLMMPALLLTLLFRCQVPATMPESASPAVASLQTLLQRLAQPDLIKDFTALKAQMGETVETVSIRQFNLAAWDSCLVDLVFAKRYDDAPLSHLDLNIAPACPLTLADLAQAFGAYQQPPARRPGQASAQFSHQPTPEGPVFVLIAQVASPLEPNRPVSRLSIRVE